MTITGAILGVGFVLFLTLLKVIEKLDQIVTILQGANQQRRNIAKGKDPDLGDGL